MDNNKLNAINEAVCFWLGYQFKIGRERLIHEASLRYPIADTLTATGVKIEKLVLEKAHPIFKDRVVDIFVCDSDVTENEDFTDSISEMYELKLAKKDTNNKYGIEHQRVIDDILRLAYFNLVSKKDCYFLICGRYQNFKNYFIGQVDKPIVVVDEETSKVVFKVKESRNDSNSIENQSEWIIENSLYKDYFEFEIEKQKEYTFQVNSTSDDENPKTSKELKFGLKSFQSNYKIKNSKIKNAKIKHKSMIKIKTTCMAITPFEQKPSRTHACGIWKIECVETEE